MFPQPFDVEKMTLHSRKKDLDRELNQMRLVRAAEKYQNKQSVLTNIRVAVGRMMVRLGERLAGTSIDSGKCVEKVSYYEKVSY